MKRFPLVWVALAACFAVSACTDGGSVDGDSLRLTQSEVTELIAALGEGQSASLEHVGITKSVGYGTSAGTHEDDLAQSGYKRADVAISEYVDDIETSLLVPMWYSDETIFQPYSGDPMPLPRAEEATPGLARQPVWFGDPVVDVDFHMDGGVLVLDRVIAPLTR